MSKKQIEKKTNPCSFYRTLQTLGVTTSKYSTNIFHESIKNKHVIDLPIECCVFRINIKTEKRLFFKQLHETIIVFLEKSIFKTAPTKDNEKGKEIIVTGTSDGSFAVWSGIKYDFHFSYKLSGGFCKIVSVNLVESRESKRTFMYICCDYEHQKCGKFIILELDMKGGKFIERSVIKGDYFFSASCGRLCNKSLVIQQDDENPKLGCFFIVFEHEEKEGKIILKEVKKELISKKNLLTAFESDCENEFVGWAMDDRSCMVMDLKNFKILKKFQMKGGRIYSLKLYREGEDDDCVFYAVNNGRKMLTYSIKKEKKEKFINIPKIEPFYFSLTKERSLWMCNESVLKYYNLNDPKDEISLTIMDLTGCGLSFNHNGNLLVTGDLSGNVFVWDYTKSYKPIKRINVLNSVRAMSFKPNSSNVQAGCFDGNVYNWNIETEKYNRLFTATDGITCMAWENGDNPNVFACGTSGGVLMILEAKEGEDFLRIRLSIKAHKPWVTSVKDERFGSISKFAEVWSLCFSPDNKFIATASEDQTICIWDVTNGEKVHMFCGHESAVTCVKWGETNLGEVLCSCADDQKVIVWRNNSKNTKEKTKWHLYHVFSSAEEGLYWHTLTYLELDLRNGRIVVVTQNGYVLVFDLSTKKLLFKSKVHRGSIEGLTYSKKGNRFASISADCCCSIFELKDS